MTVTGWVTRGATTIDTSPVVEFVPSLTEYCTGTTPVNVAFGAVYVNEPVAESRSLIVPSPDATRRVGEGIRRVRGDIMDAVHQAGDVRRGNVAFVLERVPQVTGSAAIGPISISTVELLVPSRRRPGKR